MEGRRQGEGVWRHERRRGSERASDVFNTKIYGTFKRSQLTQGRKVLSTLDMISKLVHREERRLLYVALTRARKRLFILYVMMDSNWQMLQPSRFLKELPSHLLEIQVGFVIDERLSAKKNKSKDVLCALKSCLSSDEAFHYAEYVKREE